MLRFWRQFVLTGWLPLFLVISVSWLFAPAVHHHAWPHLFLISHYEAWGAQYGWVFRFFDFLGAITLGLAALHTVRPKSPTYSQLLLALALLWCIDVVFASSTPHHGFYALSNLIHSIESVLSVLLAAYLSWHDSRTRKHLGSILFIGLQLGCLIAVVLSRHSTHSLILIQYIYQLSYLAWLAWLVRSFLPSQQVGIKTQKWARRCFGIWALINGVVIIALTLLRAEGREHGHFAKLHGEYGWIMQHGIIVGVLMLYLARHVLQGQRRAAVLLGMLFVSQAFVFSIFHPQPFFLACSLFAYAGLWTVSSSFNRNTRPLKLFERAADGITIVAGVLVAAMVLLIVITISGQKEHLHRTIDRAYGSSAVSDVKFNIERRDEALERSAAHFRKAGNTLIVAAGLLTLWSLFRPSRLPLRSYDRNEQAEIAFLLRRYSTSSEDYFKLWPTDKQYFFNASRTGFIAYKKVGSVVFALSGPVGPPRTQKRMAHQFIEYCREHGLSVCFLLASDKDAHLYAPLKLVRIGASAVIPIDIFCMQTVRGKWWRWQKNRAQKAGYNYDVSEPPHTPNILKETSLVSRTWLTRAGHTEQSFALGYYNEEYLKECRLHILRDSNGKVIAFANQLPTFNDNTQATVDLIRFLPEYSGAMPILIMSILFQLHSEARYTHFDLGFVPLARLKSAPANIARRLSASRFSAEGLEQFKGKFNPDWQANYIAYDGDYIDLATILTSVESALRVPRK